MYQLVCKLFILSFSCLLAIYLGFFDFANNFFQDFHPPPPSKKIMSVPNVSFWRHSLENSKKLDFYKVFKDEYVTSDYLNQLRGFNERRNLVKFRVSNHKLMIELGRYQTDHMPRETRLCPLCKSNIVENETHFLLQCSKYSLQRQTFFNRINEIMPDIERKSTSESIKLLMNSNDYHVNKLVMKFDTLLLSSERDVT